MAFIEVSKIYGVYKIYWPFKAVGIEGIYDEVSELDACQIIKRPRRILIGLICQRFKDGVHISNGVAKGIRQFFRDRKPSL